ncbi:ABC transporter substrate-binding protein [Paenibacillus apiarius]|uniref:ABC transporter substrate-binding protein n=1 Tax=Paenibacillus apiarius TaxID=46240 RepID=A0ABT4DQD7_9BACL|nr:ABC transporter substrate-binding protein [Paenibacillus apiarius]MCY9514045.1 ABC transporter substrate-binding protein [Paenibacillus apiarius]MCY9519562.1 ABC transporter substrate-binding protein [Paenibacillus apiarius]MCY9552489.1 ABC transporter substrate-binding protein [Paenibacillus apiarius]MCY9556318.1 ABC transporter substrate-binding protein [Paenibacillus apiarius]MCY9681852.1 ABC transporter substrate-binding protein [Paenibacillus apiarius]
MNKKFMLVGLIALFMLVLAACGGGVKQNESNSTSSNNGEPARSKVENKVDNTGTGETRTIEYLGEKYTVPQKVEKIVITGAMEAMEDAVVLDVHPAGAISIGGKFPKMFASVTGKSESIGEKQQPNLEKILQLKPDVILGSTKFQKEVVEKLQKIAPTILVSHISTDWESNLKLMAELTGKQAEAEKILSQYKTDTQAVKASLKEKLQGKKVAAVRIRGAQAFVYPKDVYFNPVLYDEFGLEVPQQISVAKTQEAISAEQLAEMNPDYLFVQFSISENDEAKNAFEDLKKNPIIQNINAFKQDHVYVNVVEPLMEGGPAYSRIKFLESVQKHLDK